VLEGIVFAVCGLAWSVSWPRYIRALAAVDPSIPEPVSVGLQMRARPSSIFSLSVTMTVKYLRAIGQRQEDEELEGLRRWAIFWLVLALASFAWFFVS
jgi:hypothetical protein